MSQPAVGVSSRASGSHPASKRETARTSQGGGGHDPDVADAGATLARRLGAWDATAIVVSNVVGGGIFFVPVIVAGLVPDRRLALLAWLVGGLLALAGAMAYAELAALRPRAGAEYVYLREAFGELPAFLTGWTSFVAGFSGAIAASAVALAGYLGRFVPAAADARPILSLPLPFGSLVVSRQALVALAVIAAVSWVHHRGLGPGRLMQNTLAILKVLGLAAFVALGLGIGAAPAATVVGAGAPTAAGFLLALVPVMFTYSGWNAAAYVAEEVRDPGRNVPRALAMGTAAVIVIYLGLNLLYMRALPGGELAELQGSLADTAAERLFSMDLAGAVAAFSIVSIAASISAMVLAGPRVYLAMARDGLFFAGATRIHPRFQTPSRAIWLQAAWSGVLVLSGTLAQLVGYTGFAVVLFAGIAVLALFVLRRRLPREPRPFRAWGYPLAPALFVAAALLMVLNILWREPATSLPGLAIILAGVPLYFLAVRRRGGAPSRARDGRAESTNQGGSPDAGA
jgi:APA family basic amino acid/polyamine antiporter